MTKPTNITLSDGPQKCDLQSDEWTKAYRPWKWISDAIESVDRLLDSLSLSLHQRTQLLEHMVVLYKELAEKKKREKKQKRCQMEHTDD